MQCEIWSFSEFCHLLSFETLKCQNSNHRYYYFQEHFYDIQSNTGFLEWSVRTVQRQSKTASTSHNKVVLKGGPTSSRAIGPIDDQQSGDDCMEAMSLLHHTTDRDLVFQKMRETFLYRQQMIHDPQQSADMLQMFPRFLDTKGLVGNKYDLKNISSNKFYLIDMIVMVVPSSLC